MQILKVALAEAGALQPPMRSAVLWQASNGLNKLDRARAVILLKQAFRAAVETPDDNSDLKCPFTPDACHSRVWLQSEILEQMASISPDDVERLLPQAESTVHTHVTEMLIVTYVHDKKLAHARELLTQVAELGDFPYDAVLQLMQAEPAGPERAAVFNIAVRNYGNFGDGEYALIQEEDLATLVIRFWHDLPAPDVLAAVDTLLDNAKDRTQDSEENHISYGTKKGRVTFSFYQYRLFELLPVLDALDSARADSLRREQAQVSSALEKYPKGLQSLNPALRDTPLTDKEEEERVRNQDYPAVGLGTSAAEAAQDQAQDQEQLRLAAQQEQISDMARTDPKQALEMALSLPLWQGKPGMFSPRAMALVRVGKLGAKKDPDTARKAIDEASSVVDQGSPRLAGNLLLNIVKAYLSLDDKERAEKALDEGMKLAKKMYESDTDASDPNLALKASWPSSALWRSLVVNGAQISATVAERLIAEIPDEEIRAYQRVSYANSLLGVNWSFRTIEFRRSMKFSMGSFIP